MKIVRSPPGMDPKKNDKDKKKKNSDKEGFKVLFKVKFDDRRHIRWILTGLILSYLYENIEFDLAEKSTENTFLNVSYFPKWTNEITLCLGCLKRWCTES